MGEQRDNARGREGKMGYFLFYFIILPVSPMAAEKRGSPHSPARLPPTYLALGAPSLDPFSFLPLLHLDLRRKWTFYETEIMARRQSEVRRSPHLRGRAKRSDSPKIANLSSSALPLVLLALPSKHYMSREMGHPTSRHCAAPMIKHRRTVTT